MCSHFKEAKLQNLPLKNNIFFFLATFEALNFGKRTREMK